MESEKILMAAGVTVAAVVGAFVFWGPSGMSKYTYESMFYIYLSC